MITVNFVDYMRREAPEHEILRPHGSGEYLFLYFPVPMRFYRDREWVITKKHACILFAPDDAHNLYRDVQVYISGARHMPPPPSLMYQQVKNFYADLQWKGKELNQIEMVAWIHAEFAKIHPFQDGNGRTSRLIMNY